MPRNLYLSLFNLCLTPEWGGRCRYCGSVKTLEGKKRVIHRWDYKDCSSTCVRGTLFIFLIHGSTALVFALSDTATYWIPTIETARA